MSMAKPVTVGLIGTGRIGSSHARILARRVPDAELVAVADARPEAAHASPTSSESRHTQTRPRSSQTRGSRRS